jgi:membrane protein
MTGKKKDKDKKQKFRFRDIPSLVLETGKSWSRDDPWRLSAVVAYYALLALPGLLVVIINSVGAIWGPEIVQGRVTAQIAEVIGEDAAGAIKVIVEETQEESRSFVATVIGIGTLIFGATGVFYHLQISINKVWEIKPVPGAGLKKVLIDRALSFAFVLVIGFLMLISFILTTAIGVLNDFIRANLPEFTVYFAYGLNELFSFAIITLLFALMYRFLPDAKVRWSTVWIGAIITAALFVLGKFLLGMYFGHSNPASAYGAAGSVVLILLWVSYSSLIFFFGAEFTFVYAKRYGLGVEPQSYAVRVKKKEVIVEKGSDVKDDVQLTDEDDPDSTQ